MLITNHVLSGAVIGVGAPDARTAAWRGFVSHFVLDAVPHFGVDDEHLMRIAVPDGLVGLATIYAVARRTPQPDRPRVLAGIFGACLPDIDKPGRQFFGRSPFPPWFDRAHSAIQTESTHRWPTEIAAALVSAAVLAALVPRRSAGSRTHS